MADIPLSAQSSFRKNKTEDKKEIVPPKQIDAKEKVVLPESNDQDVQEVQDKQLQSIDDKIGQQIQLNALSNSINDNALKELDQSNQLQQQSNEKLELIGSKLDALSKMLKEQIKPDELPQVETSSDALKNYLEPIAPESEKIVQPQIMPESEKKKPSPVEAEPAKDQSKSKGDSNRIDNLKSVIQKGFKSTVGVIDKVSSMLFKYTLTAALASAKFAMGIFALILGIDLIRVYIKYFSDLFQESFEKFYNMAGTWGPIFDSIFTSIDKIRNMWESGDWGGLALAVVEGLGELLQILVSSLALGLGKLGASILRAFGMDKKADALEGASIQQYQQQTNAQLKPEDQEKLAKYQSSRIDEGKTSSEGGFFSFLKPEERKQLGLISDNEYKQIKSEQKDNEALKKLPENDRVKTIMQINETSAALKRYESHIEAYNPKHPNDAKRLKQSYDDIKNRLNNPAFNNVPAVKAELDNQLEVLTKKIGQDPNVKAEPSAEKPEAKSAQAVQAQQKLVQTTPVQQSTANVQNTVISNRRSVAVQSPITSTHAPGVFGATKVN